MNEFNLSEKINEWWEKVMVISSTSIRKEQLDIIHKEFIRRLKEELLPYLKCEEGVVERFDNKIDKLVGEKLI